MSQDTAWSKQELGAAVLASVVVVGSALGLAGLRPVVLVPAALAAVTAFLLLLPRRYVAAPTFVFMVAATYTLLQAIPLPVWLVSWVASRNHAIWSGAFETLGGELPRWVSISLDPSATLLESLKWLSYAALFGAAAALGGRRGALWAASVVWVSAVCVALVTMLHGLAGATRVYGLYSPSFQPDRWNMGPLLNGNNLSGYLNLGALAGLGLSASRRMRHRIPIAVGTAALLAASVLAGSRGGALALVLGVLAFVLFRSLQQENSSPDRLGRVLLLATLGFALVLGVIGASRSTWGALSDRSTDKVDLARWGLELVREHAWFGVGRGAYGSASFGVARSASGLGYEYPENIVIQWCAEWGLPCAAALALALLITLKPLGLAVKTSTAASGICAGVFSLIAQNFLDFSLELPAVGYAVSLGLGGSLGEYRTRRGIRPVARPLALTLAWAMGAVSVGLAALIVATRAEPASRARTELHEAYRSTRLGQSESRQALEAKIRDGIRRYPADPYFPRLMALVAFRTGEQNPLPWINRALELAMTSGRTHLLLARMLLTHGKVQQGLLELRLAAEAEEGLTARAASIALGATRNPELLLRAVPTGRSGAHSLTQFASQLNRPEEADARLSMLREAQKRAPDYHPAWVLELQDLVDYLGPAARTESCRDRERCNQLAQQLLTRIERLMPNSPTPLELKARWLAVNGKAAEAQGLLAKGCRDLALPVSCLRVWMEVAVHAQQWGAADEAAKLILMHNCADTAHCAKTAEQLGDRLASLGAHAAALPIYVRSVREEGTPARWQKVSSTAARLGFDSQAREASLRAKQMSAGSH